MPTPKFKRTKGSEAFGAALERQLGGRSQKEFGAAVAQAQGLDKPYSQQLVSQWINGKEPSPEQAIAIERALSVRPGMLTKLLGFVPTAYKPAMTVVDAINSDERLDADDRQMLLQMYRQLQRRSEPRQRSRP